MKINDETYPATLETIRVATIDPSYQIRVQFNKVIAVRVPSL